MQVSRSELGKPTPPEIKLACEITIDDAQRIADITCGSFTPFEKDNAYKDIDLLAFHVTYRPDRDLDLFIVADRTEAQSEKNGTYITLHNKDIRLPSNALIIGDNYVKLVGYQEIEKDGFPIACYTITEISKKEFSYREIRLNLGEEHEEITDEVKQAANLVVRNINDGRLVKAPVNVYY